MSEKGVIKNEFSGCPEATMRPQRPYPGVWPGVRNEEFVYLGAWSTKFVDAPKAEFVAATARNSKFVT